MDACPLCQYRGKFKRYHPRYSIIQCPVCSLVFYPYRVTPETLYTDAYFAGAEYFDYVADRKIIQANFKARIQRLRQIKPSGKLLEIGCAYGFFLDLAKDYWDVQGIDIYPAGIKYAREELGLNVTQADFLELPEEPAVYDVICMWDTIEHLQNPVETVYKASRWLKQNGVLAITTGNIESALARVQGDKWRQIHPPTHLYYFSPRTLRRMVDDAGMKVETITHVGYARSFQFMLYGLFVLRAKRLSWLYRLFTLNGKINFPVYLNLFDIMLVIARKTGS